MLHRSFRALVLAVFALTFGTCTTASAQQVVVQHGATAQVSNGSTWHLQGATMDFGDVGATATLDETNDGRMAGGILVATRTLGSPSSADPAGLGVVLSASGDLGDVTVTRGHEIQTGNGNQSIARYYDLSVTGTNSGLSATLTHHYHDAELNGRSESSLELFKSTDGGATWTKEGANSRDASANTVTLSKVDSFSRWTLGGSGNPLPVELASFEGEMTEGTVRLTWRTASEQGNAGFQVERKGERGNGEEGEWETVGFVDGAGTTREDQAYRFMDEDLPYAADSLSYRLKQVDTDGSTHLSAPVTITRGSVRTLQLLGTYPNPAHSRTTIRFSVPRAAAQKNVQLHLYDLLGRQVQTVRSVAEAGRHQLTLNVDPIGSGVYFLRLHAGGQVKTQKLTVVR